MLTTTAKYHKKTSRENVYENMSAGCCSANCIDSFKPIDVISGRTTFHSNNEMEKLDWLVKFIWTHLDDEGNIKHNIRNNNICVKAFCIFYGISKTKYYRAFKKAQKGAFQIIHGNSLIDHDDHLRVNCIAFLEVCIFLIFQII